jgi:hypothetical protein
VNPKAGRRTAIRWVNRAFPDAEIVAFVDDLARRVASFDRSVLTPAKKLVSRAGLPDPSEMVESLDVAGQLLATADFLTRLGRVRAYATDVGSDFELRLGHHVGHIDGA